MELTAVDELVLDEAALTAGQPVLVVDAPAVAQELVSRGHPVTLFCDDIRDDALVAEDVPRAQPGDPVEAEVVVMRLPKSLDALDEYASWARTSQARRIVAGGRQKDLEHSMNDVLGRHFEGVHASRGRRKARVLHAEEPRERPAVVLTWPRVRVQPELGLEVAAHGATFGGTRLDAGTRLLLDALLPRLADRADVEGLRVLDWGSGNGLIAAAVARALPAAEVVAVDASWAAADATRATAEVNQLPLQVVWGDGNDWLRDDDQGFDLVVSNPPYHRGVAHDSGPARELLALAPQRLRDDGEFWLVHNSHLPWLEVSRQAGFPLEVVDQNRHYTVSRGVARLG